MTSQEPLLPAQTLVLAPVRRLATAATVLIVASCAANVFETWTDWNRYQVVDDYLADEPGVGVTALDSADNLSAGAGWLSLLAQVVAAVLFLSWLSRARRNAEMINSAEHRLSRGWTIGGWFCPVVNIWYPRFIVDDIWRTSRPGVPNDLYSVQGLAHSPLVRYWWYSWLASWIASVWLLRVLRGEVSVSMLQDVATISTVLTLLQLLAGALLIAVIRQITEWQSIPRPAREDWRRA